MSDLKFIEQLNVLSYAPRPLCVRASQGVKEFFFNFCLLEISKLFPDSLLSISSTLLLVALFMQSAVFSFTASLIPTTHPWLRYAFICLIIIILIQELGMLHLWGLSRIDNAVYRASALLKVTILVQNRSFGLVQMTPGQGQVRWDSWMCKLQFCWAKFWSMNFCNTLIIWEVYLMQICVGIGLGSRLALNILLVRLEVDISNQFYTSKVYSFITNVVKDLLNLSVRSFPISANGRL